MKVVCLIPARLKSTRLNEKLIQLLDDKTVIQHTYLNALNTNLFSEVVVVGDSDILKHNIDAIGGKYISSDEDYECGTDRIAAVAKKIDADIFINVQGDEPFIDKSILEKLILQFANKEVNVASLMFKIAEEEAHNPNFVKVVVDTEGNAMLFSRSIIPYNRDSLEGVLYFKHIGIYAFRKLSLMKFASLPISNLERIEKLENLRFLQNGIKIKMIEVDETPIGIDTIEDLEKARNYLKHFPS